MNGDSAVVDIGCPPDVFSRETLGAGTRLTLDVTSDLACFDGHFPGEPILPAVVQIDWAIQFGRELGLDPERFAGFRRLKFKRVVEPPARLELTLQRTPSGLHFRFVTERGLHSDGTVLYNR